MKLTAAPFHMWAPLYGSVCGTLTAQKVFVNGDGLACEASAE